LAKIQYSKLLTCQFLAYVMQYRIFSYDTVYRTVSYWGTWG